MKLIWSIFVLFSVLLFKIDLKAETGSLYLRAFVRPSLKSSLREKRQKQNKILWLYRGQTNSEYPLEGQKFEVEGMDQAGLEAKIVHIAGKDRMIELEILITSLKLSAKNEQPVFLKISAN